MSWYLDSSAILKIVLKEKERSELLKTLTTRSISSRIARVEVKRTVSRVSPLSLVIAEEELAKIDSIPMSFPILSIAENFPSDITLRTLDAIHIATVMSLEGSIEGLITYDKQMIANAKALGINVIHPGMK